MHLILIRHAQSTANVLGRLDAEIPGPDLTELGRAQAAALPLALSARDIASIHASTMIRTQQTAAPLAQERGLEIGVLPGLREIGTGDLEKRSDAESVRTYLDVLWAWTAGDLSARLPGAEDGRDFFDRYDSAIDEISATPTRSLRAVFSHGASIRVWVSARCRNVDSSFGSTSELHNTGAAVVTKDARGWELLEWTSGPLGGGSLDDRHAADPTGEAH